MNTNKYLLNNSSKRMNAPKNKFKMKIYHLLFSLVMITCHSYAQWVEMREWPTTNYFTHSNTLVNATTAINGEGGIRQVAKLDSYQGVTSNPDWPYRTFSMYQYETGTISLGYGGNGSLSTISGGIKCYIYPFVVSGGSGLTGMKSSSHPRGKSLSWLATEAVQVIDQPCSTLKVDSKEINRLNFIVTVPTFYLGRSSGRPANAPYEHLWRAHQYNMPIFPYGYPVRMGYGMIACRYPWQSRSLSSSDCSQTLVKWGDYSNKGEIIEDPIECSLSGDGLLNFGKVSPSGYHYASASSNLNISCTKEATVKLTLLQDGKVDLGPFKVKVVFDNNDTIATKSVDTNINTIIMASILSTEGNIEHGEYQNSIILIANIE